MYYADRIVSYYLQSRVSTPFKFVDGSYVIDAICLLYVAQM